MKSLSNHGLWIQVPQITWPISSHQFKNYNPCPSSRKIAIADGSLISVAGIGDVQISPTLILRNVLHVPKVSTNLVSIQKLTQDLGCIVSFFLTYCVFQDQDLGKRIGLAKEQNRLYYLEIPSESSVFFLSKHHLLNEKKNWLHHHRLGHLSFQTLKLLFPSLFNKLNVESFYCDVCELAKTQAFTLSHLIKEVQNLFI